MGKRAYFSRLESWFQIYNSKLSDFSDISVGDSIIKFTTIGGFRLVTKLKIVKVVRVLATQFFIEGSENRYSRKNGHCIGYNTGYYRIRNLERYIPDHHDPQIAASYRYSRVIILRQAIEVALKKELPMEILEEAFAPIQAYLENTKGVVV